MISQSVTARFVLGVLFCTACFGCGGPPGADYSKVDLVSVDGVITLDDKPLSLAVVTFESPETGTFSYGMTDVSGRYTLQFDSVKDGVTPGPKIVQISTTRRILGLNVDDEGGDGEESGEGGGETESGAPRQKDEELVPECYNKTSNLKVEVQPGATTFDFNLKSDCSTTGPSA